MSPVLGWVLAVVAVGVGWQGYGWSGVALAVTVIVFWLLLQFSRALRVMKKASNAPVGHVDSAVMLNAKLKSGMTLMQVISLTRSLGSKVSDSPETWAWSDAAGARVTLTMAGAKLQSWALTRPDAAE
jgi:Flp pilus assembly protein TadB